MQTLSQAVRRHWPLALPAAFLLAPALYLPSAVEGYRSVMMYAVAFALMVVLLARASWSPQGVKRFFTTGPNLALVLFVGLGVLSFVATAPAAGLAREVAVMETLRLVSGAVVFFAVLYRFSSREQLKWVSVLLPAAAIVAALAGLATWIEMPAGKELTGAFANKQLYGGFLAVLLPMCVVFAAQGKMDARRMLASVATVLVLGALLMTENRASWIGGALSVALVAGLMLRHSGNGAVALQKHRLVVPVVMVIAALGIFLVLAPQAKEQATDRATTLAAVDQDGSWAWRLREWGRGVELIFQKPLFGHGIGSYAYAMAENHPNHSGAACLAHGKHSSMSLNAHNEMVQTGVELGLVGLALYLAFLGAFFLRGFRALGRIQSDTRKWLLIAAMGAVAAQFVDSLANPAWRFGEVTPVLWLALGLGMAATRTHRERGEEPATAPVARPLPQRMGRLTWQLGTVVAAVGMATTAFAAGPSGQGEGLPLYCFASIEVKETNIVLRSRGEARSRGVVVKHNGFGQQEPLEGCAAFVTVELKSSRHWSASPTNFVLQEPGDEQVVTFTFDPPSGRRRREFDDQAKLIVSGEDGPTGQEVTIDLEGIRRPRRGPFRPRSNNAFDIVPF
ncbi:MAG: O-antigen ligase family protein [Armatimonadota bacterium]